MDRQLTKSVSTLKINLTAAQRVLSSPELLSRILFWDAPSHKAELWEYDWIFPRDRFIKYALVNSIWFHEAMRFVWWNGLSLAKLGAIDSMAPLRRVLYLKYVVHVNFHNDSRGQFASVQNRIWRGLMFPALRVATLHVRPAQRLLSLPEIRAPNLEKLTLNVVAASNLQDPIALCDERTRQRLTARIVKMFPHLRKVTIMLPRGTTLKPSDVQHLQESLPRVDISIGSAELEDEPRGNELPLACASEVSR
ncbi:Uncharacterized protein PECH_005960 [Penicillium ucsense]|uniref:Uncharacterized protein n=1 Tax=Penicillium ucsense TaxID=2839758 RepID=A0A8J8W217_9EURO|nr:Uncharacterized protein PECM_006451 [Penicillium ucsense]KAF7735926.1 Uncharacterized protein PECH_005960 [Penicillium ucsense]